MSSIDINQYVSDFHKKSAIDKFAILLWYGHAIGRMDTVDLAWIKKAFIEVGSTPPNLSQCATRLAQRSPPLLVRGSSGVRMTPDAKRKMTDKYIPNHATSTIPRLLAELPAKIPALSEKRFLEEALSCYRVGAFRASIVMAWNLAFSHFQEWVLADPDRISKFNAAAAVKFQKSPPTISEYEDFLEIKEADTIEIARIARLIDKNRIEILREKLKKRNAAAHPSRHLVTQLQADDVISDLVNNVILAL